MVQGLIPGRDKGIIRLLQNQPATSLSHAPVQWVLFWGVKQLWHEADCSPASSGNVYNDLCTAVLLHGKHCVSFSFTVIFCIIYRLLFWISVALLLDEPTWDLDPLNTYLVISILSNHARKYGRIVVLTMEKPRSDVFPFLDRVAYLCLGDVVYTGGTRLMLDYFRSIGFPCPELENPLMYYCKYKQNNTLESVGRVPGQAML